MDFEYEAGTTRLSISLRLDQIPSVGHVADGDMVNTTVPFHNFQNAHCVPKTTVQMSTPVLYMDVKHPEE